MKSFIFNLFVVFSAIFVAVKAAEDAKTVLSKLMTKHLEPVSVDSKSSDIAFKNAFFKQAKALGKLHASGNLRASAPSAYVNLITYTASASCTGAAVGASLGLDTCFPDGTSSTKATSDGSSVTITSYTDAACSAGAVVTASAPLSKCLPNAGSNSMSLTTSPGIVFPSAGMVEVYFTQQADCTSYNLAGSVQGAMWIPFTGTNCFVAMDEEVGSSYSMTCTYDQLTVSTYTTSATCSGTAAQTSTVNSNSFCSAVDYSGYTSGYMYMTCYNDFTGVDLTTYAPTIDDASCFAGSETVTTANGEVKSIADVRIGDSVLAYSSAAKKTVYSDVIASPHARNSISTDFQHIVTEDGFDVKMTAEHLLPAGACSLASLPLTRAAEVSVGDCIQTVAGNSVVSSNSVVRSEGIYTIVTQDSDLVVVNNVVASPFAVNHDVANAVYSIHRMLYAAAPQLFKLAAFDVVNAVASNLAAYFSK